MKLTAQVTLHDVDVSSVVACFAAELDVMQTKRSTVTMQQNESDVTFAVVAKDPVALRATLHGITKLLTVYDKAHEIQR